MEIIYNLRNDPESIRSMQHASLDDGPTGLRPTHTLVGSAAWWLAIESGDLPLQSVAGVVSGFWPGQSGSGPAEFELQQPNGEKTIWLCGIEPIAAERLFQKGRGVMVQFVIQQLKTPFEGRSETELTISISLAQTATAAANSPLA